ncbi:MAG: RtcB family protein [Planctomycetes bacterium]|nr:RtcB family protein [Planctomycetota bacterium]MBU1517690.1 RtcB family protein [Planctomycetota bacterium]MBU2458483.1 RtcB family protein [Planctomycetota bacterium]MBU2597027.1 RtcB family protein [Planctomycetota bacterium]
MAKPQLKRVSEYRWLIEPFGRMRVPGVIFADNILINDMDEKTLTQICNVAALPGIVKASFAMPDAHMGYGFPIGGVAAFDPENGGVISGGGVGFDIACGVRTFHTGLSEADIISVKEKLAESLFRDIPAGVGSTGNITLSTAQLDNMLAGGAAWAVEKGFGTKEDLDFIEEGGCTKGAVPAKVSAHAKKRQQEQMGTLGSGNHYLEVQKVVDIYDTQIAEGFGLKKGDCLVSVHCGSRGLGHQIGTDYLKQMASQAAQYGIDLPDRELASVPVNSPLGQDYLGAMRSGINCALANRQILTELVRRVFAKIFPKAQLTMLYDVSHNTAKMEEHKVDGKTKQLLIHRKGATRAFGPGSADLPPRYKAFGQPVLIGGTMGTASYILAGTGESEALAFSSACHGAGRCMSRTAATKKWQGSQIVRELAERRIIIKSRSMRGLAEEAPDAYKNVSAVVEATANAGLAKKVAKLLPMICVKG